MKHMIVIFISFFITSIFCSNVNADQYVIMEIEGMTCKLWPLAIKKSLSATEGVKDVSVSYEQGKAWITVSESIENKILIDAVSRAGPYKSRVIETRDLQ
jgi:copper chaperone CopZ